MSVAIEKEYKKRRTFCIISHPDAGKTTTTEKFLLFGGAIQLAGTVKSRKSKKFATSDWMEIEKQRGISVTSSVMKFQFAGCDVNLLDTPGHQDFIEDTFRALTAVDSALMVIDGAKGVEAQTLKLWEVCANQKIPVIAFINKMDREAIEPLELMQQIEIALKKEAVALTWPIGFGKNFKGVYNRIEEEVMIFEAGSEKLPTELLKIKGTNDSELKSHLGDFNYDKLKNDLELLSIAGAVFNIDKYLKAEQLPVFFGSAINNFGILELLTSFLKYSPAPQPKLTNIRVVEPDEDKVSAFAFKIQANMDKNHRDRVIFIRICSGRFVKGMSLYHCRLKKEIKLTNPIFFQAQKRELMDEAYAGDIIGLVDNGNFQIADSLSQGEDFSFLGIPRFAAENFAAVKINNPLNSKQMYKGLKDLSEEGTAQLFFNSINNTPVVGVVGKLQLEVVKFRLENEYSANCDYQILPYSSAKWISGQIMNQEFKSDYALQIFKDQDDREVFLVKSEWEADYAKSKYPGLKFVENSDQV